MSKYIKISILSLLLLLLAVSCSKEGTKVASCRRTILVYMVARNSLGLKGYDAADLKEMDQALKSMDNTNDCRLLVYLSAYGTEPTLFEIVKDSTSVVHNTLKTYSSSVKSTTIERMSEVLEDVQRYAPAYDYGLVLWSHATGWALCFDANTTSTSLFADQGEMPLMRTFGKDAGASMPLDQLSEALPDKMFSVIINDACLMGCVEVAYQLRNKCDIFVSSPAETLASGMPYDKVMQYFFKEDIDAVSIAQTTYDYYANLSGAYRSCALSVINCSKLEQTALWCKAHFASTAELTDTSTLQGYIRPSQAKNIYFDFGDYLQQRCGDKSVLDDLVLYKATTPSIAGELSIDSAKYSGLSVYVTGLSNAQNEAYYKTLDWYQVTR